MASGTRYLITAYGNCSVSVDGDGYAMASLMKEFTFLDGSPFGMEEAKNV